MAVMNVNPTRMELFRLKRQLDVAKRGHKLLKGKQDAMVKEFMVLVRNNYSLRKEVETKLSEIMKYYDQAKIKISKAALDVAERTGHTEVADILRDAGGEYGR